MRVSQVACKFVGMSPIGPTQPRRLSFFVSAIGGLAAAPAVLAARQLITHVGRGVCIAAVETMLTCVQGREAFSSPADALLDELHACSEAYPTPTPK